MQQSKIEAVLSRFVSTLLQFRSVRKISDN